LHNTYVYRVPPYRVSAPDFETWVAQLNVALLERALSLPEVLEGVQIVHAHDWLVAYAARALKHGRRLPLVATMHATEYGRHNGLHNDVQRHISDVVWWLTLASWRLICCSRFMEDQLRSVFNLPADKIRVIPNGVDPEEFRFRAGRVERAHFAAPDERIVFYVGRLVREKGVQVLLAAAPMILAEEPCVKFVIAGRGPYERELRGLAERLGVAPRVYFTGYVDQETRNALYHWADVAVFPSLYEPFGLVVLEAMAARTPVVVSDTGGFTEIVQHEVNGLKVFPDNPRSLADGVLRILRDPGLALVLRERAYRRVLREFTWERAARMTREVYREVWQSYQQTPWRLERDRAARFLGRLQQLWVPGRLS
ncbi:MAG: glycosyltransferase family 4 protein, partial [Firmicutes bacterium]|nr:glycosyltransferase family 4 protein [Bacillota bacterium]